MNNVRVLSLLLLGLTVVPLLPAQAHNGARQSYTFRFKGKTWTIQANRIQHKGPLVTFMGDLKVTSNRGDTIYGKSAELCQAPGRERFDILAIIGSTRKNKIIL